MVDLQDFHSGSLYCLCHQFFFSFNDAAGNINAAFFQVESGPQIQAKDILEIVYKALSEKGYNPVNQMVGYIMSGDPTYITSHNGARSLIMKMERDELVEEMLKTYIEHNGWR